MLSSRARYATRALLELALNETGEPMQLQDVADRQDIPFKYLQQIMASLRMLGYVKSRKGPGGGFVLGRDAAELTLGEVVRALDGPLAPISCVSVTQYEPCGCPDPEHCSLRESFKEARDALAERLDNTSFAHLRDRHRMLMAGPK